MDPAFEIVKVEWAPHRDNKFVAYLVRKGSASYSLGLVNPRLLDQLTISEVNSPILDISWSPDARKVAYIAKKFNVYTASADTTFPKVVIQNLSPGLGPLLSFSPLETSTAILVLAKKTSDETGYRVGVITQYAKTDQDLGAITFLTEPGVDDAVWSPDGSKIAYTQAGELWVMDASGGNKSRLAVTGIQFPSWSRK
jgi:Tol biopolymer transport system component